MKARVFGPAAAREADDQIGLALAQHSFVVDQRGMSAFTHGRALRVYWTPRLAALVPAFRRKNLYMSLS
ncbi:hypothetical protein CK218_27680 [Mesorhizobium sp. WSM3879]|nr:hypothetical protein CK218_27680 [Mesorhizobium sp. WSM3879]